MTLERLLNILYLPKKLLYLPKQISGYAAVTRVVNFPEV